MQLWRGGQSPQPSQVAPEHGGAFPFPRHASNIYSLQVNGGVGAAVVLRMSQSDWTVNLPVVKHTLSSYLVSLLVEFTASPKFKPRHGGSMTGLAPASAELSSSLLRPGHCSASRLLLTTVNAYITLSYIFKPHASSSKHLPLPSLALRLDFSTSKDSHRPSRSSRDKI